MKTIHPLKATEDLRTTYLRYLKTIYPFRDEGLRAAFCKALEEPNLLVKGPLLEASQPFKKGRSIAQMVQEGLLQQSFKQLCSSHLPWERTLYLHQDNAIERSSKEGRNLIIATGTGSGKTEAFLIPILDHLLREEKAGTLKEPGVRALLLYPMNALANDQLKRLREILKNYPSLTFGRYTGETKETQKKAEEHFYQQFPGTKLLENELISREQMQKGPPQILLTNYAMLEYLLLRPKDCVFFDGETGKHWKFIVLDEAHVYDGASGIEIALLLRRLKDRITESKPGHLRCFATSATLGSGEDNLAKAAEFAQSLFAEAFTPKDVIKATRIPITAMGKVWGECPPELYAALHQVIESFSAEEGEGEKVKSLGKELEPFKASLPTPLLARVKQQQTVDTFLYELLKGDGRLHNLHDLLAETPQFLNAISKEVFPNTGTEAAENHLIALVNLAVRARPAEENHALLPARYHTFVRALEGTFACLNHQAHEDKKPQLFLKRYEECPFCKGQVFELAICNRCGATYLVGNKAEDSKQLFLRQLSSNMEELGGQSYFLFENQEEIEEDEDEEVVAEGEEEIKKGELYTLCLGCGKLVKEEAKKEKKEQFQCACGPKAVLRTLHEVKLKDASKPPSGCIACNSRSSRSSVVFRFLTGQDAPVSVLATALYQHLPTDPKALDIPGEGRKLLIFSDSRQDAAFFAPYLERTYKKVLQRRLILKTLLEKWASSQEPLRFEDIVLPLRKQAEGIGLFTQSHSSREREKIVQTWLMQELVALDRRLSLEGTGLIQIRLVKPERWQPPAILQSAPWNLAAEESWKLLALLLDTLRQKSNFLFPEEVDPKDDAFAPLNREYFVRGEQSNPKESIFSWLPSSAKGNNRRLNLLVRLLEKLGFPKEASKGKARETLQKLWQHLTAPDSCWRDHLVSSSKGASGIVYRLSYKFWEFVPLEGKPCYRCNTCQATSAINLRELCPINGCKGKLESFDPQAEDNHYRKVYLDLKPIPLIAQEHTAQWTSDQAGKVQEEFVKGVVNALSCSTTFELGVDVGELQAVLMRNMPPTTANYVQRAGRAGRRTDSAAFALTFAQRRSHDLTHYSEPQKIVAGKINSPQIRLLNTKIIRRHMQAVLLAAFFRAEKDQNERLFRTTGDFFQADAEESRGPELLKAFAESKPPFIQEALTRIVPQDVQDEVGVTDWGWLKTAEGDGLLDLLEKVDDEVVGDIKLYRDLEEEASRERKHGLAGQFQKVTNTIRSREILGFLASRNILPKYGFPTFLVPLKTDQIPNVVEARQVELQRDLRIAIAEYAPEAQVVAGGKLWTSGGLAKRPDKGWERYHYATCPECNYFHLSKEKEIGDVCDKCGEKVRSRKRGSFGSFIIPEFGFVASKDADQPGEARPLRFYSSRVHFAEYDPQNKGGPPKFEQAEFTAERLEKRYSRFGQLVVVNAGELGLGFQICQQCGFASKAKKSKKGHKHPLTGRDCTGPMQTDHLGHKFLTDVVELRLSGPQKEITLWRSLVYALLEGAAAGLSIRRDDLDGTLHFHSRDEPPAIILFDNVPGGAGHVFRIHQELETVFKTAFERVSNECCGPETSCYECLRNYYNQPYHNELRRGLVRDFLKDFLAL